MTTTYLIALNVFDLGLLQSRTAATTALIIIGLYLVLALEATSTRRARLVGTMCGLSACRLPRSFSSCPGCGDSSSSPSRIPASVILIAVGCGIAIGFLWLTDDRFIPLRSRSQLSAPGYDG